MSKPQLPSVSEDIRERAYKPSGKWTWHGFVLIAIGGLISAIIIGLIGHYVGRMIPYLALAPLYLAAKLKAGGIAGLAALFTSLSLATICGLAYPVAVGAAIGYVIWLLARMGKCRSPRVAGGLAALDGILGYGVLSFVTFRLFGMVRLSSEILSTWFDLTSTPWWLYILVLLDALLFVFGAYFMAVTKVEETPFCESCQGWYSDWQGRKVSVEIAEPLLQTLETGSAQSLRILGEISSVTEQPYLEAKLRRCPSCDISDFQIAISVAWEEVTTDKEGKEKTEYKSEEWFKAMVPAELGTQLDEILFGKE